MDENDFPRKTRWGWPKPSPSDSHLYKREAGGHHPLSHLLEWVYWTTPEVDSQALWQDDQALRSKRSTIPGEEGSIHDTQRVKIDSNVKEIRKRCSDRFGKLACKMLLIETWIALQYICDGVTSSFIILYMVSRT
ncbi:hypothetical protein BDR07DRAFT_1384300 [Suillus spraguei]|nr:hypothetical protein BDR07DRAFT_1384300 [Suillus spraguei]